MLQVNKNPPDGGFSDRPPRKTGDAEGVYKDRFKIPQANYQPASPCPRAGGAARAAA